MPTTESEKKRFHRLFSDTAVLGLGTFGSKVLVFLLVPLYTALLSTAEYGVADIVAQTANLLIPLASVGVADAVFRFAADREEDKRIVFSSALAALLAGILAFLLLSPLLFLVGVLRPYVLLVIFYVICSAVHSLCANYLRALGHTCRASSTPPPPSCSTCSF